MEKTKDFKHFGMYAIILKDDKILLIKKNGGPYDSKLDLPGGTIEFGEKPEETLARELLEEVGIEVKTYELFDVDSVFFDWPYNDIVVRVHHIGIFYKVTEYLNDIKSDIEIDSVNDDSFGAEFYGIEKLDRNQLSKIAIMELEKLGYKMN